MVKHKLITILVEIKLNYYEINLNKESFEYGLIRYVKLPIFHKLIVMMCRSPREDVDWLIN